MLSCARVSTRPVVYSYMHLQLAGESKGAATFTEVALSLYGPRVSLFDRYMIRFHALKYTRLATLHTVPRCWAPSHPDTNARCAAMTPLCNNVCLCAGKTLWLPPPVSSDAPRHKRTLGRGTSDPPTTLTTSCPRRAVSFLLWPRRLASPRPLRFQKLRLCKMNRKVAIVVRHTPVRLPSTRPLSPSSTPQPYHGTPTY